MLDAAGAYTLVAYSRRFIGNWDAFPAKNSSKPMLAGWLVFGLFLALVVFLTKSAQS